VRGSFQQILFRLELRFKEKIDSSFKRKNFLNLLIYLLTLVVLCGLVILFPYKLYDSDSMAYSYIGQRLAFLPIGEWCAPEWWGHAGHIGLFQDHPPGVLWVTALFVRAGIPGQSAALSANFLYIFLLLYFLYSLISHFGGALMGWGAVWASILTPIFLQYLIRANQELPLAFAIIAGIYGLARSQESWLCKGLFIFSLIFAVFFKGINALILTMTALVYWIVFLRSKRAFFFIIVAHLFALGVVFLFEIWYRTATYGVSFWLRYISLQGGEMQGAGFQPLQKIYNLLWYLARALWFPFPWVFFVIYGLYQTKRKNLQLLRDRFLQFSLISSGLIILFFSFFDRKADRYIFPAYWLLVLSGVWILFRLKPNLKQVLEKRKNLFPLYFAAILILFTLVRIWVHSFHYRFIKF